ncbi:hypothetical protein B0H13DRAFT_1891592 [Mycena leptocephala]|nr:hypothetical protein B0H13DRAFT_1891592 [Mycena leptocephala]
MYRPNTLKNWAISANTGIDHWSRAEEFIAKRRSGEVDVHQHLRTKVTMSATQIPLLASASMTSLPPSSVPRTLREHCDFALFISFAPAFPNIPAKGNIGPTAGNLPGVNAAASFRSSSLLPPTSTLAAWDISHEAGQAWRAGVSGWVRMRSRAVAF